jgi:hypothetical protein
MIEIHTTNYDTPIHCIQCGNQTVSSISNFVNNGTISTCPHLVYLGKGEGFDKNRPEYCKFYDELMQIGSENYLQTLREELDNEHVILNISSTSKRYFVVYNLGDISKEKKYFSGDKDCPYWNVWGPTLKKYGIHRG